MKNLLKFFIGLNLCFFIYGLEGDHNDDENVLTNSALLARFLSTAKRFNFSEHGYTLIEDHAFDSFHEVRILDLSQNKLKRIDENVLSPLVGLSLRVLDLSKNNFTFLKPSTFKFLAELNFLSLSYNPLKLTKALFPKSLMKLKILELNWCKITVLDDDVFDNLKSVTTLSMHKNSITSIPRAFQGLVNLRDLDISHTDITSIETTFLGTSFKLENLHMIDSSNLVEIGDCAFCGFPRLKNLWFMESRKLQSIHENAFGSISAETNSSIKIPDFESFDIQSCNVTHLPEKLIKWKKVRELHLANNPYHCGCKMAWFINDIQAYKDQLKCLFQCRNGEYMYCGSPPELNGREMAKLRINTVNCNGPPHGSHAFLWFIVLLFIALVSAGVFLAYTRRLRLTNYFYRPDPVRKGYNQFSNEPEQHISDL